MSGLHDPAVGKAYDAVRDDKDPINWLLLSDIAPSSSSGKGKPELGLAGTGTGGLTELAGQLDDAQAQYAYVRVEYANDAESTRTKFILVVWIGEGCKVMRKARVSVETAAVKEVAAPHSIQVDARDRDADLNEQDIVARLRKAGGADYNGGRG